MSDSRPRSIASTLTWMNILTIGIALMLAYASFLAYSFYAFREAAVRLYSEDAQIVGANSITAIEEADPASAVRTLSALSDSSDLVAAAIYTSDAAPFAQYPANGMVVMERKPLAATNKFERWVDGAEIVVASRIDDQGKPIGVVYLQAHLSGLERQATLYAAIAGGVLVICLLVALMVGSAFRRMLTRPIVSLARTARLVSRYRDYSLRFEPELSYNELESLTEAFNEMLAEIEARDVALENAKNELEQRVEERTAQLQAANRELEAFSYAVAHDLRAPLQTIDNICYLMVDADRGPGAEERAPMLGQLSSSVAMMSGMISDLLDLSRSTSVPIHTRQLDLSLVAEAVLDGLARANPGRKVETVVQKRCHVNADAGLMQVVLQNLLRNAWKFTGRSEHPKIEFGCTREEDGSVYFVRDNGAGFDQRLVDRLFKPFQRLHAASDYPGTGIGLTTVYRIIRRHGGEVWAEGEVDKGATFYFTLEPHKSRAAARRAVEE
jgi:signal transduction histidine kinase